MRIVSVAFLALALLAPTLTPVPAEAYARVSSVDSNEAQSAILSAGSRASQIAKIRNVPSIGVIDLSFAPRSVEYGTAASFSEFKIMAERNYSGIQKLRRALAQNPATRAAIAKTSVSIKNIAGVSVSSNGSLRLFILR